MVVPIISALGPATYTKGMRTAIRLVRHGCCNRPFYHISVMESRIPVIGPVIEQIGSFDPMPNIHNEKLVAINLERFNFWLGAGSKVSDPVLELLEMFKRMHFSPVQYVGLMGYLPMFPRTYYRAWKNRRYAEENKNRVGIQKTHFPPLGCCLAKLTEEDIKLAE